MEVTVGVYRCDQCGKFFTNTIGHIAPKRGKYTHRVIETALHHMKNNSYETTHWMLRRFSNVDVPVSTLHDLKWQAAMAEVGSFERRYLPEIKALGKEVVDIMADTFDLGFGGQRSAFEGIRLLSRI